MTERIHHVFVNAGLELGCFDKRLIGRLRGKHDPRL
jgi:hypothetical protein